MVTPRAGAAVAHEVLEALDDLPGLLGACVFDVADGAVHAARDAASRPPASLLSWAAHAREVSAHRRRELEDVIITSTDAHHLLRGLPATGGTAWVYVHVDARRGNLALTRRRLARVATDPEPRTRPTPRPASRPALAPASRPQVRPALPAAGPPAAVPLLAPTTPMRAAPVAPVAPVATAAPAVPAPAARTTAPTPTPAPVVPSDPARAAAMPALAMLPPLDESWGLRRPSTPTTTPKATPAPTVTPEPTPEPTPAPTPEEPELKPVAIPAPRRVLTQRPRIELIEPPTVPPPPAPDGRADEPATSKPEDDPKVAAMLARAIALAADDETGGEPTPAGPPAPAATGDAGDTREDGGDGGDRAGRPDALPTRTPGEHGAQVPSPRPAPSERTGWGTDGGTLRRLLVGLRRLA